ncbi:MAG: aminotransferase class V-fold PLP-dependent enzyme [Smithellaceae bacterium]|nr:aminotransferase class V-fold PLP-dependent enzyme [Smithellaceae bacterium]
MGDIEDGYNRREFLQLSGKTVIGAGVASLLAAQMSGCASSQAAADPDFWQAVRQNDFTLSSSYLYVNNSTFGTTLKAVQQRMSAVGGIMAQGCYLDRFVAEIIRSLSPLHDAFATLANAHTTPTSVGRYSAMVSSVTEGMSLVANGITFSAGDVIITTDHEHTGGLTMWKLQADRYGARVIQVPLISPGDTETTWRANLVERFRSACTGAGGPVRVISFPAITCSTGHILPARDICALARSFGAISVVDGAQAFTVIPLDVQALDCDALVVNGHKYLCGPVGSGFLTVHPRLLATLSSFWPTIVDDNYYSPANLQRHFPQRKGGVVAYTNVLPLMDALAQVTRLGMENITSRLLSIGERIRTDLLTYPDKFEMITPVDPSLSCFMTCFRVRGIPSETVYSTLRDQYAIHAKHASEGFPADATGTVNGAVRLSPHYYLSESEMTYLLSALHEIAGIR